MALSFDTNINQKDRKRFTLSGFRGVDTANPVYEVDKARATAMRNFININGCNHKRPGWKQVARFKDESGRSLPINGVFDFTINKESYRIVYAGTSFYIYDKATQNYVNLLDGAQTCPNRVDPTRLKNQPCQMFVYDNKAYFIGCGDFLVFADYEGAPILRRVYGDADTYIPRTTTNIPPNESDVDENGNAVLYPDRQSDRDVNILSRYRKNELIGSEYASAQNERTYNLDATDIDGDGFTMSILDYDAEKGEIIEHTINVGGVDENRHESDVVRRNIVAGDTLANCTLYFNNNVTSFGTIVRDFDSLVATVIEAGTFSVYAQAHDDTWDSVELIAQCGDVSTLLATATRSSSLYRYSVQWLVNEYALPEDVNVLVNSVYKAGAGYWDITADLPGFERMLQEEVTVTNETEDGGTVITIEQQLWGYIDFHAGKITLVRAAHSTAGEPNIFVQFAKSVDEDIDAIPNCRFGALFGANGNANTLFLAGNKDMPNCDFWSSPENFTYFPSGNKCACGTENTAIIGYQRLGDDSLAIFKGESRHEPTLYIRTGVASSVSDDNVVTEGYFVTSGKYITQGAVSQQAIAMLNGDALFLSKLGVYGVAINSDSIAVEQRVAKERSRFINELLRKHENLSAATAIVYDNRYYLAIDDAVYVADARFTFTETGDMADTYNYEWWVWSNCPVRQFYELDNALYFGTDDGRLCVFDEMYSDRKYERLTNSTFDVANNRIYGDNSVELNSGDLAYFKGDVYRLLLDRSDIGFFEDNNIFVTEEDISKLHIGQIVYASDVQNSGLSLHTKYIVNDIDFVNFSFTLNTENGEEVVPTNLFKLMCNISDEIVRVRTDMDGDGVPFFTISNLYTNETYRLALYNGEPISAVAYKYIKQNVVSEWYTPVLDMGANDYVKQLLGVTIATEQITNGNIAFGWETKSVNGLVNIDSKGLDVFDFSNLNFDRFAFDTGFSTSYSKKVKAAFNFIIFRFISDNEHDSSVYSFTIDYKLNRKNKGVW